MLFIYLNISYVFMYVCTDLHLTAMQDKWKNVFGPRFEAVLAANGGKVLVGKNLTYSDILLTHCFTWFVEEVC